MTDGPVLVIGGTRGTGLLIARLLQRQGYAVRILARDPNRTASFLSPQVGVVPGDITRAETLPSAMEGIAHIVFTAGCASGRPASEHRVRATEYDGVRNTLAAAQQAGFAGRFLYMTSSAVAATSNRARGCGRDVRRGAATSAHGPDDLRDHLGRKPARESHLAHGSLASGLENRL